MSLKNLIHKAKLKFLKKYRKEFERTQELARITAEEKEKMRLYKGGICKKKILERLDNRHKLIAAREKRKRRRLKNGAEIKRKHLGLIEDNGKEGVENDFVFYEHEKIGGNCEQTTKV